MKYIPPSDLSPGLCGRWITSPASSQPQSISASWASASLSFRFTGSTLRIQIGKNTERKDKMNGGTKMIAIMKNFAHRESNNSNISQQISEDGFPASLLLDKASWAAVDPPPGTDLIIHDQGFVDEMWVRIVLIDWASTFEIEGLITDDIAEVSFPLNDKRVIPGSKILLIGDSISLAFASPDGPQGETVPFGVLDAFPFVAQRRLVQKAVPIGAEVELYSYPGWLLVAPTAEDMADKFPAVGMSNGFFWDTPWSREEHPQTVKADIVLFAIGTNDQFFEISPDRFHKSLRDLTAKLLQLSPSVAQVWLVPPFPDCDTENTELVTAISTIAEKLQSEFGGIRVSVCDLVKGLGEGDTMDGVHLTLKAHDVLGEKLAKFEEENLS